MSCREPVLYLEEVESTRRGKIDWRMFIMYNTLREFLVYGTRRDETSSTSKHPALIMTFKNKHALLKFLSLAIGSHNLLNVTMYYMPLQEVGEHSFDVLTKARKSADELFGYDQSVICPKKLRDLVDVLQNIV